MTIGFNLDLLLVGLAVAASVILGFIVFFRDTHSMTNKVFLFFTLVSSALGVFNYLSYQLSDPFVRLWLIRFVMFFSVFQSFFFFLFIVVFPQKILAFSRGWKTLVVLAVAIAAILTLSPYVFSGIMPNTSTNVSEPIPGPGIFFFAVITMSLIISGIILLLRKMKRATPQEKNQLQYLFAGTALMFMFLIGFNFIFPAFLGDTRFVPLNAAFTLPFIGFTFYAILKYRLLNIRVIAAEILMLVIAGVTFLEIILAHTLGEILFRSSVFGLLLIFGILLIRSVRKEVEQRERLEQLTRELDRANAQLAQTNEKLAGMNEKLEKMDALKSEFVSMAGHQLRGPMTVIKGYISLILDGTIKGANAAVKDALKRAMFSTEQLVKLIAGLLDLSRIEAGKIRYEMVEGDMAHIISEVMDKFKEIAKKKGVTLAFENHIADEQAKFIFDQDKIREAVVNLVDNAIKYSFEGGRVAVALDRAGSGEDARMRVGVRDSGIGIKQEDIGKLFDKFSRTEEAKNHDPNGLGIGLYFAKRVVEDHGGRAWVESEGIGKGSIFYFELPVNMKE